MCVLGCFKCGVCVLGRFKCGVCVLGCFKCGVCVLGCFIGVVVFSGVLNMVLCCCFATVCASDPLCIRF